MSLLIDQSIAQLEILLRDAVTLALKRRIPPAADVTALRLVPSVGASGMPSRLDGDLVYVNSKANVYRWTQASTSADDGDLVIKPNDNTNNSGRWLKTTSPVRYAGTLINTIATGVLKNVVLHNGDFSDEALRERIYAQAPCVAIHFAGEQHKPLSQVPGALYDYRVKFDIWSVSRNYRDAGEGAIGSGISSEAAADPGVMKIHGAVKKLLAGQTLGESGIKWIEIHGGTLVEADQQERVFVMSLETEIYGSIHNADDPSELTDVTEIDPQFYEVNAPTPTTFDLANCVTSGLTVPLGNSLTTQIAAGGAFVGGVAVNVSAATHSFNASKDTYRDLTPAGAWVFTEVANGATPNAPTAGNLRVAVTVTDAAGIVADQLLSSVYVPYPAANSPDIDPV